MGPKLDKSFPILLQLYFQTSSADVNSTDLIVRTDRPLISNTEERSTADCDSTRECDIEYCSLL